MMPDCQTDQLRGVVEGFYGRPWSFQTRTDYAQFIADLGLNTYLYCPKSDPYLRKQWQKDWPVEQWQQMKALANTYREHGVHFGLGLSPFALYLEYGASQRKRLKEKVCRLAELDLPLLAVLFDDMPGDIDALATRQAEIIVDIINWLPETRVMMCPTYYSFDPVLEKHFGQMPHDYWKTLGREIPQKVDIFWTGNNVCSETIERRDIERIRDLLGKPPLLWDNYPVNDGAVRSQFLYLESMPGRERLPASLLRGHLCNPMNQALLSLPALTGLAALYQTSPVETDWLSDRLGARTSAQLQIDKEAFSRLGLDKMGSARRIQLEEQYRQFAEPGASEVADWLAGQYTFDPACLTD